jgi:hypothetical protein
MNNPSLASDPPRPRFSDARVTFRWVFGLILPIVVTTIIAALLLPQPEPALAVALFGGAMLVTLAVYGVLRVRPPLVPST